jgi:hypothetical protein
MHSLPAVAPNESILERFQRTVAAQVHRQTVAYLQHADQVRIRIF